MAASYPTEISAFLHIAKKLALILLKQNKAFKTQPEIIT